MKAVVFLIFIMMITMFFIVFKTVYQGLNLDQILFRNEEKD